MRVADHVVENRRKTLAGLLRDHRYLPVAEICRRLSVSEATARRDLAALAQEQEIRRTFGGAVAFYNARFPSFRERLGKNLPEKQELARRACALLAPGCTCFLDSGTTPYMVAEEIKQHPVAALRVVTANLPVAELLAGVPEVEVHLLGGQLVGTQSVLLGPTTKRGAKAWRFDLAFFSAEGMDREGLWNSQAEIVDLQKAVLQRTEQAVALLDRSKLGRRTPYQLSDWKSKLRLLTTASPEELRQLGIPEKVWGPEEGPRAPRGKAPGA
jgi:DeoR/GlpR family transcriptional regulator of sugar metabolism